MNRGLSLFAACLLGFSILGANAEVARACPMCKTANEADQENTAANARPRAYMYSILFMLAVPATILTGFSIGFYRLAKKQQALQQAEAQDDNHLSADGAFPG